MTSDPAPAWLDALADEQQGFAALAATADLDTPVAACAPWTVDDLVRHLAAVHRWAAAAVRTPSGGELPDDVPFDRASTVEDYPAAAATLRDALADGQRACVTLVGPGAAEWWARRQLHETLVHRLDLAAALGAPIDADPAVAADCVAEVVDTLQPRQVRLGRMRAPETGVRLVSPSGSWTIGPVPAADVTGPDLALAQLLWRRTTLDDDRITVTGDRPAAAVLLADRLTP